MSIFRKVKLLEEYVAVDASAVDPAVELAIEKLLKREACRMDELRHPLLRQKTGFEEKYGLSCRDISPDDGKLRIRSTLAGGGVFECFFYVRDTGYVFHPVKCSFHWQDAQEKTVRRWDNAPHHKDLPYAPHHLHIGNDHVEGFSGNPSIFAFFDQMEKIVVSS